MGCLQATRSNTWPQPLQGLLLGTPEVYVKLVGFAVGACSVFVLLRPAAPSSPGTASPAQATPRPEGGCSTASVRTRSET